MSAAKVLGLPELVYLIVEHADFEVHRQLLTVSRLFQVAVETIRKDVWHNYVFRTDSAEDFLNRYYSHRSRYLRSIEVDINFPIQVPTDGGDRIPCRETAEDLQSYNELFTHRISALFTMIKALEDRELPHNRPRDIHLCLCSPRHYQQANNYCYHRDYLSWRLQLLTHDNLPTLLSITSLGIGERGSGKCDARSGIPSTQQPLDYSVIPALVSKLPNLHTFDCPWLDEEWPLAYEHPILTHYSRPWEGPWRDSRHAFGSIMQNVALPAKLGRVSMPFCRSYALDYHDDSLPLPDLISPLPYDPFSSGLRTISQHVVDLTIYAYPHMKRLQIEFQPMSPSGTWYFQGPRGEGRETASFEVTQAHYPPVEENSQDKHWHRTGGGRWENFNPNMFRIAPIDKVIEPFLDSFVKALEKMPLLEEAELFTRLQYYPSEEIDENYDEYGEEQEYMWGVRYFLQKDSSHSLLEWHVGNWRPNQQLLQRFRDIASRRSVNPLEEIWMDWKPCSFVGSKSLSSICYR